MSRVLVKTSARGWFVDAAAPDKGKVRKQDGDEIFDNLMDAQQALEVLQKSRNGPGRNGSDARPEPQSVTLSSGKLAVGPTVTIKCQWPGCKQKRTIKPQDAFQVRYCLEHQKAARAQRLKEKRAAKRQERGKARDTRAGSKAGSKTSSRTRAKAGARG